MAIARAKGAISASYQVALPVLPGQCRVIHDCCLGSKYGGWRRSLQRHFVQVLVSRKSSVNVCSVVLGATAVEPASRQPSKRVGVRELCIDAKRPLEKEQQSKQPLETERQLDASQKEAVNALHFYADKRLQETKVGSGYRNVVDLGCDSACR